MLQHLQTSSSFCRRNGNKDRTSLVCPLGPCSFYKKEWQQRCFFFHASGKAIFFLLLLRRYILSLRHYSFVSQQKKIVHMAEYFFHFVKVAVHTPFWIRFFLIDQILFFTFCKGHSLGLMFFFDLESFRFVIWPGLNYSFVFLRFNTYILLWVNGLILLGVAVGLVLLGERQWVLVRSGEE